MAKHDLNKPLQSRSPRVVPARRPVLAPALVVAALFLAILAAFWVAVVDDPDGGRSVAVAEIGDAAPTSTGSIAGRELTGEADRPADTARAADQNLQVAGLPAPPPAAGGADAGLIEHSAFGPLPRVSPAGRRPRDAYARRAPSADPDAPRIVIVVNGMGLSQTGTQAAIEALPEDVTLAFAPYGASLQRWIDKARAEGHEVLLQVPLEPEGYPEPNPGEHTLLVSNDRHRNEQDLQWVLARTTGYAGVMNHMGARFTSEDRALLPFLGTIGERGLFYLDDGSSPRSLAGRVGGILQVPVVTGDLTLDLGRSPAEIERELAALESIARKKGLAVGVASAFPISVEVIARWAREAPARGIAIVPASAAFKP